MQIKHAALQTESSHIYEKHLLVCYDCCGTPSGANTVVQTVLTHELVGNLSKKKICSESVLTVNSGPTSLVSVSFFLFSDPCEGPLTGAWWPGRPGTNTLLLALTIGVFTWKQETKDRFSSSVSCKFVHRAHGSAIKSAQGFMPEVH